MKRRRWKSFRFIAKYLPLNSLLRDWVRCLKVILHQQPMMGGRLIIVGTETALHDGGYMEGAVNSANNPMKMLVG